MSKIRVVQYINQFFAQIGGEEKADIPAELREGPVGPGLAFNAAWGDEAEVVATIICGDSYFNENLEKAQAEVLEMVKSQNPDLFIAGPAFNAGRYGVACGTIAKAVQDNLNIPVLTGMYVENPGADMFKKDVYIVATKNSAAGMRDAVKTMAPFALKLARHEAIGASCEEGYMPNGVRVNLFEKERGSARAVKMLIAKLNGKPFTTEFPMPSFDRVAPNQLLKTWLMQQLLCAHPVVSFLWATQTTSSLLPLPTTANTTSKALWIWMLLIGQQLTAVTTQYTLTKTLTAFCQLMSSAKWKKKAESANSTTNSTPQLVTVLLLLPPKLSLLSTLRN